jgi:hypothetical protein
MGVRVEWIGLPSPWADPGVQIMKAQGKLTEHDKSELRKMESKRQRMGFCRLIGVTAREFSRDDGFTRDYKWGPEPGTFVLDMEPEDVELLMKLHDLHRQAFRVLDEIVVVRR